MATVFWCDTINDCSYSRSKQKTKVKILLGYDFGTPLAPFSHPPPPSPHSSLHLEERTLTAKLYSANGHSPILVRFVCPVEKLDRLNWTLLCDPSSMPSYEINFVSQTLSAHYIFPLMIRFRVGGWGHIREHATVYGMVLGHNFKLACPDQGLWSIINRVKLHDSCHRGFYSKILKTFICIFSISSVNTRLSSLSGLYISILQRALYYTR